MTDIPRPTPGDTDWIDWADDEEAQSDLVAAATAAATANTLVKRSADTSFGTTRVYGLDAPVNSNHAANKGYVDGLIAGAEGIKVHDGTTGGGTRPTGYARVRWVGGTTQPTNMAIGDVWEHDV